MKNITAYDNEVHCDGLVATKEADIVPVAQGPPARNRRPPAGCSRRKALIARDGPRSARLFVMRQGSEQVEGEAKRSRLGLVWELERMEELRFPQREAERKSTVLSNLLGHQCVASPCDRTSALYLPAATDEKSGLQPSGVCQV